MSFNHSSCIVTIVLNTLYLRGAILGSSGFGLCWSIPKFGSFGLNWNESFSQYIRVELEGKQLAGPLGLTVLFSNLSTSNDTLGVTITTARALDSHSTLGVTVTVMVSMLSLRNTLINGIATDTYL